MCDTIYIIQQKPCQTVKLLKMSVKMKNGGVQKCAISHIFCAESHTQHNGILLIFAKTKKKGWRKKEKYL
jgi:hypothetical protein